ncbi:Uncharacterised protein [Serratia quinivorans]|nr:Uncharacterised protein [Serratia quinivorans]
MPVYRPFFGVVTKIQERAEPVCQKQILHAAWIVGMA